MTERCTCHASCRGVDVGIFIDGHEMTGTECRDLINELLDERKELRYANNIYTETIDKLKKSVKRQQSSNDECAKLIKQLQSENEDMRILIANISDQRDEFLRGVRQNAKRVGKLERENQQLKDDEKRLRACLNEIYIISSRESVE